MDSEDDVWEPEFCKPTTKAESAKSTIKTTATTGKKRAAIANKLTEPVTKKKKPAAPRKPLKPVNFASDSDEDVSSDDAQDSDDVYAEDENVEPKRKAPTTKAKAKTTKPKTAKPDSVVTKSPSKSPGKGQSIEQIYQKKTQLEHILLRPDTYVGSIEPVTQSMWVFDEENKKMEMRKITFTPGLFKIFDEIIVNACDNKQRDKTMDTLRVTIDAEKNEISVWNNGKGIPVALHKEHNVHVPELIFGHLLTGSNFDDKKKKTVGGRNGYGAKLANIFSKRFVVETADGNTKQRYKQVFSCNMSKKETPVITSWTKKDYTCITFTPDLERFKMTELENDIVALFKKRVYDVAGVTDKSLNVYLNGEKIAVKSFTDYVAMYKSSSSGSVEGEENGASVGSDMVIFDKPDERWQVGIGLSDDGFQQVSFVNGICTTKGGQHVNYIADQVVSKLIAVVKKKNKGEAVKPNYIKNHMTVYVSALIDNPAFDSQTKETLTTRSIGFGSTYTLSDKFLKQIEKSGMVERILSFAQYKQTAELRRKGGGGAKKSKLTGISKLDDANHAGTAKAQNCTLILTEGDSAKSLAISGLSVVGRDYYGVFPLKGKLLNVREASHSQILKNEEIQNLVKILGLKYGQKYDSTKSLRYGHLMIMTDQDHDGSHIKGLVINFIHHFWPSLLQIEGFLQEFITPIVKCTKARMSKVFYTMPEYEAWREENNNGRGWSIKYYKGLGTSTSAEAKEYFSDLRTHQVGFVYEGDVDGDSIDMAFSKKRVEDRKDWLRGYETGTHVDYDVEEMAYAEFVNKELILFSMADNIRSIPNLVDGFKPSQRKVLFACLKRNLKTEIKVAQLAGYVSEHSAYHHGEASLNGTIINMAQDFVGSNNIHLLSPNGQFGTRLLGGKDAASPRYIFTNLEALTRCLFDPLDNDVLNYLDEDGQSIEPEWYAPVIPMVLVNGSDGIGTGWSTSIPNYNPSDIIRNIRHKIKGEDLELLTPWYRGFTGTIVEKTNSTFVMQGLYEVPDESTLVITELPVKTWTHTYKQFLEALLEAGTIKDFRENHTDTTVLFTITLEPSTLREITNASGGIVKKFKLETSISTSNMHLFDAQGNIKKYESPLEILNEFYDIRLDYYGRRKTSMLEKLAEQVKILSNKTKFILSVVKGKLVINNRKKDDLLRQLVKDGYDQILTKSGRSKESPATEASDGDASDNENETADASTTKGFDYLLSMKLLSLTKERVEKLQAELQEREQEYKVLEATSVEDLWLSDLNKLDQVIAETEEQRERIATSVPSKKKRGGRKRVLATKAAAKKRKKSSDEDSDSEYEVASKPKIKARLMVNDGVDDTKSESKSKPVPKQVQKKIKLDEPAESANVTISSLEASPSKVVLKKTVERKVKPISSYFTSIPLKSESDEEDDLSLSERLARRAQASQINMKSVAAPKKKEAPVVSKTGLPKEQAKSEDIPEGKRVRKAIAVVDLASSDDEVEIQPRKPRATKKVALKKNISMLESEDDKVEPGIQSRKTRVGTAKPPPKKTKANDSDDEEASDFSEVDDDDSDY